MKNISYKFCSIIALISVSACGGSGTAVVVDPAFVLANGSGAVAVVRLDSSTQVAGLAAGEWSNTSQSVTTNGQTLAATGSAINNDYGYVRSISSGSAGETFVYSATDVANLPAGSAVYVGDATVVLSDAGAGSVSYSLTGISTANVDFATNDLDLSFTSLTGTKTAGLSGPAAFTSTGSIDIDDLAVVSGAFSSDSSTTTTITGIDAVAMTGTVTTSASGGVAGSSGQEIVGVASVSDANTILLTTFVGQ